MSKIPTYQKLAIELHALIEQGTYPPGSTLPRITDLAEQRGLNEHTVRQAYGWLEDQGLVNVLKRHGTIVRDRTTIRVPLSRYGKVLTPGGTRGPWETATFELGLAGRMAMVDVGEVDADQSIAAALGLEPGTTVHRRRRRALIDEELHHLQTAFYPLDVAERAGLVGAETVIGGIYGAMSAAGWPPVDLDETVRARMPKPDEATELHIGSGVPLLLVERITRDRDGRTVELLRITAPADRIELSYDRLPLGGTA
jgi:GntR family transcriptional regulator